MCYNKSSVGIGPSEFFERVKLMKKQWAVYPSTPNIRSGCKVGWRYYDRLIDAKECARAATINAELKAELGYDFGYCCPGHICKVTNKDSLYFGKYEVCIP